MVASPASNCRLGGRAAWLVWHSARVSGSSLGRPSYDELAALVEEQAAVIAALRAENAELRATAVLRGHLIRRCQAMSMFGMPLSRQDSVDSRVNRRDMLSIIAQ